MGNTMNRVAEKLEQAGGDKVAGDVDDIKASFTQLRHDVMGLLNSAFGLGRHGAEAAKDNAADAVESLKSRLNDLKDQGADKVHSFEKKIEDNPLPAALIAFGIGFVIAKILTRR